MKHNKTYEAIVMHAVSRWDQPLSSASFSLAKEFSKEIPTFYVDHPFTLKDVLLKGYQKNIRRRLLPLFFGINYQYGIDAQYPELKAVTPFVVFPINWLPKGRMFNFLSRLNNKIYQITLKKLLRKNHISSYIYFNSYNPFFGFDLKKSIKPDYYVYQSRDNIANSNYVKKHGPELERYVAEQADIRIATSTDLTNILSRPKHPFICFPNGADTSLFKKALKAPKKRPSGIATDKKIIGYIGNIGLRVDYDLLVQVANRFKDCQLLMVGPYSFTKYTEHDLHAVDNITFIGPKNISELPSYLHYMDCALMPFKCNALTKSIYPLKINEYLAGGKAVVTTNFSPDLDRFEQVVYKADDHATFLNYIEEAMRDDNQPRKEARIQASVDNSWENRIQLFWKLIEEPTN